MRRCHWIKENKISETPQRIITIAVNKEYYTSDLDSGQTRHDYACCITGVKGKEEGTWKGEVVRLENHNDLWTLLETFTRTKTRTYLVCEDSWTTVQMLDIFNSATDHFWTMSFAVIDCPPLILRFRRDKKTVVMMDIANIWPTPSSVGVSGDLTPCVCESSEKDELSAEQLRQERIARALYEKMTDWWSFLRTNDLGGFSPTIGAQSFRTWRHKFMTDKILIDCHDDALALARRGLYGGRVECGWIGEYKGEFYQLDINSSYADTMANLRVPVELKWHTHHASLADLYEWSQRGVVIADVTIYAKKAAFPVRGEEGVLFPHGSFRTVLCGEELVYALVHATIVTIHEASCYSYAYAFRAYMNSMWIRRMNARDDGNDNEADKYKLLMNSFFGKWAQTGCYWEKIADADDNVTRAWLEVDYDTQEVREMRTFGGIVQEKGREKESSESSPAIAACITSSARMQLWDYMQAAGLENVFYVDTDSLLLNTVGYRRVFDRIDARELGALKLQGKYARVAIRGCKDYELESVRVHSGVPKGSNYSDSGGVSAVQRRSLAAQIAGGGEIEKTRVVNKVFTSQYRKGIVTESGRVEPLYV